VLHTR